jgi:DHA2 family multidrug resistance protein
VRRESYVMAYNDGFFIVGAILLARSCRCGSRTRSSRHGGAGGGGH